MTPRNAAARRPGLPTSIAPFAHIALVAAISVRWMFGVNPQGWLDDRCAAALPFDDPGILGAAFRHFAAHSPIGTADTRGDVWIFLAVILLGVVVCRGALSLFRGPSRILGAVVAGVLATESCWPVVTSNEHSPLTTLTWLAFTIISMVGVFSIVRALVQHGKVTGRAFAHTVAASLWLVLIDVQAGVVLGGLLMAAAVTRRFKGTRRSVSPIPWKTVLLLVGFAILIAVPTLLRDPTAGERLLHATNPVRLDLDGLRSSPAGFPARLYLPACALLLVLVAPLRWRGGLTMISITFATLVVTRGDALLGGGLPAVCLLSVCAGGWIWLAGTITTNTGLARVFAVVSTLGLLWWGEVGNTWTTPTTRPTASLSRVVERGLAAPRDVVLMTHPTVRADLEHQQRAHGVRPDIEVVVATALSDEVLVPMVVAWNTTGQRVLSDSFDLEGRWDARLAIESGMLYWFIFDAERVMQAPSIASTTALHDFPPSARPAYALMQLEKARYRRALGRYELAGRSLSIIDPELSGLATATATAERTKMPSNIATMLTSPPTPPAQWSLRRVVQESAIEAGDLLFHLGNLKQGESVLYRAGLDGAGRAWSPLLRWLAVSGQTDRANTLFAQLVELPNGPCEALQVLMDHHSAAVESLPSAEALLDSRVLDVCGAANVIAAQLSALAQP